MSKQPLVLLVALLLVGCMNSKSVPEMRRQEVDAVGGAVGGLADKKTMNTMSVPAPAAKSRATTTTDIQEQSKDEGGREDAAGEKAPAPPAGEPAPDAPKKPKADANPAQGMYIIRHGNLTLQVNSVKAAQERVGSLVKDAGGFISDSRLEANEGGVPSASLTVRVPAQRFDELLNHLGDVGNVRTRQVSGDDVTLEYVDTTSRIRNMKKEEGQLLELLKRTGKLSEVLEVERELARVRGEIERAQGRIRHLSNQVDLATIEITLTEQVQVSTTSPWNLGATVENAWRNAQRELAGALDWLVATSINLVVAVLPLFLLGLALFLLVGAFLRWLLVGVLKLLPAKFFGRLWLGVGFVALAAAFPPLFGLLGAALLVVFLVWAGGAVFGKLFGRRGSSLDS